MLIRRGIVPNLAPAPPYPPLPSPLDQTHHRIHHTTSALKKSKEELLARKAAKKAANADANVPPSSEGKARPRVSSASRRRGTAFVKPDAVPDAHDIAEMEKSEGVKEKGGAPAKAEDKSGGPFKKAPMERRGTGFVKKENIPDVHNDPEPKKKSKTCIIS